MPLRTYLFILSLLFYTSSAFSAEAWWLRTVFNTAAQQPNAQQYVQESSLFDCTEGQTQTLCSDLTHYYDLELYVELEVEAEGVRLVRFSLPYSDLSYTKIQSYLRKDGFALGNIEIGQQSFNVNQQIDTAKQQGKDLASVDKALIKFINLAPKNSVKVSRWQVAQQPFPTVLLVADSLWLTLELTR